MPEGVADFSTLWETVPCYSCSRPVELSLQKDPEGFRLDFDRLCQDCREKLLEGLARKLDPTHDPDKLNEYPEVLDRLYCWPPSHPSRDFLRWRALWREKPPEQTQGKFKGYRYYPERF